jgi:naphthalene 1,2-dioxygenase system ferredoxin subunit
MADGKAWQRVPVELPTEGSTRGFSLGDCNLLLCNVSGTAYVIADRCSHANAPLARGRLTGHVLECPLHGGKIDVRDGSPVSQPIRKRVATYATRTSNGAVEVSLEREQQETDNA